MLYFYLLTIGYKKYGLSIQKKTLLYGCLPVSIFQFVYGFYFILGPIFAKPNMIQ